MADGGMPLAGSSGSAVHFATATHGPAQKTSVDGSATATATHRLAQRSTAGALRQGPYLAGKVLIKRTSEKYVQQLGAAAYAQDGHSAPHRLGCQQEVAGIPRGIDFHRRIQHGLAVARGVHILASAQNQGVCQGQRFGGFGCAADGRKYCGDAPGGTDGGHITVVQRHHAGVIPTRGDAHDGFPCRPASGQHHAQEEHQRQRAEVPGNEAHTRQFLVAVPIMSEKRVSTVELSSFSPAAFSTSARK